MSADSPRPQTTARPDRPAVLFLCGHNAGRSQMAAGWLRHLALIASLDIPARA